MPQPTVFFGLWYVSYCFVVAPDFSSDEAYEAFALIKKTFRMLEHKQQLIIAHRLCGCLSLPHFKGDAKNDCYHHPQHLAPWLPCSVLICEKCSMRLQLTAFLVLCLKYFDLSTSMYRMWSHVKCFKDHAVVGRDHLSTLPFRLCSFYAVVALTIAGELQDVIVAESHCCGSLCTILLSSLAKAVSPEPTPRVSRICSHLFIFVRPLGLNSLGS